MKLDELVFEWLEVDHVGVLGIALSLDPRHGGSGHTRAVTLSAGRCAIYVESEPWVDTL